MGLTWADLRLTIQSVMLRCSLLFLVLILAAGPSACDSASGPEADDDPRWSGPTRVVVVKRSFDLANTSLSDAITVRFDTPDILSRFNVVSVERSANVPVRTVEPTVNGMKRIEFDVDLPPDGEKTLEVAWRVSVRRFDALGGGEPPADLDPQEAAAYLASSPHVQSDHPSIEAAALQATDGLVDDLARIQAIVDFVRFHLEYELQGETKGALWALENGKGDCTEYSTLGVAMARAVGIPARVTGVENMVATAGSSTYDNHNAAEFWLDGVGWLPVDINYSESPVGVLPTRCVTLRWGLMTDRDREANAVAWYTWRTVSGPTGQLEVRRMGHVWTED